MVWTHFAVELLLAEPSEAPPRVHFVAGAPFAAVAGAVTQLTTGAGSLCARSVAPEAANERSFREASRTLLTMPVAAVLHG